MILIAQNIEFCDVIFCTQTLRILKCQSLRLYHGASLHTRNAHFTSASNASKVSVRRSHVMLTDAVRDLKCGQGGVLKKANTFADVMYGRRSLEGSRYSVSLTVPNGMLHSGGKKP